MEFEVIHTERLMLRKLTPAVFAALFENCSDSEIKNYLGLNSDAELAREREKLKGGYVTYDRTIMAFLLVLKDGGETIGRCGYHNWYADHSRAELGYAISKEEHKRKGYMREAVAAILNYGFNEMNLIRIEAGVGPTNTASLRIVKKSGFTQEGYLRKHYVRDGEVQDTILFSLLKEEYEATNAQ